MQNVTIKRLTELSSILNIRAICSEAGLNYAKIRKKISRYRRNENHGLLDEHDIEKLNAVLGKYGIDK